VHPFGDGNGRTARLAMNLALSAAGLTRIIIPTAFREDYVLALKALSHNSNPEPYVRMLKRAADFSRWLDFNSQTICFEQLHTSNALKQPTEGKLTFTLELENNDV
jgi:Fic family protein